MDDDYLVYFEFAFIIGSFIAFLSSLFTYYSQQELNKEVELANPKALRISKLRNYYEEYLNGLFIIEFLFYFISISAKSIQIGLGETSSLSLLYLLLIIIATRIIIYSLGMRFADNLTLSFSGSIYFFSKLASFFFLFSEGINNLLGGKETPEEAKDELSAMFESAREEGNIDEDEYRILKSVVKFSDVLVEDVMTPRTVVFSCPANITIEELVEFQQVKNYSRIPVWDGESIDDGLRGYVLTKDVLHAALTGDSKEKLKDFTNEMNRINENSTLDEALEQFLKVKQQMFAVVDDYGGFEGIITLEDVVETVLGFEIVDEADQVLDLREMAKRKRDRRISIKNEK